MALPVVEFSREGYKIRKFFFAKNQMKLPFGVKASCQKLSIILEHFEIDVIKKCQ
jgi:hypothetical protein